MSKTKKSNSEILIDCIIKGMQEKKAKNITILNLTGLKSAPTDYFIICHGESDRQVEAIGNSIDEVVKKETGEDALHIEGMDNAEWVLLDYFNVVAHVFNLEKRQFYALEELWGDAEIKHIEE